MGVDLAKFAQLFDDGFPALKAPAHSCFCHQRYGLRQCAASQADLLTWSEWSGRHHGSDVQLLQGNLARLRRERRSGTSPWGRAQETGEGVRGLANS